MFDTRSPRVTNWLRRPAFTCVLGAVLGVGTRHLYGDDVPASAPSPDPSTASWREAFQCGPNALYLFLKFHGKETTLARVREKVRVEGTRGASLASLAESSEQLGMPVAVVKTSIEGLRSLQLPAIVHQDSSQNSPFGHFSLFLGVGKDPASGKQVVFLIDPIMTQEFMTPVAEFERYWSTYALVPRPRMVMGRWASYGVVALGAALLLASRVRSHLRTRTPRGALSASSEVAVGPGR